MSAMFEPRRLPDGRVQVPVRAVADDGTVGDGVAILGPGDDGYDEWVRWFNQQERESTA